ncbi:MAG: MGMT family protein [Candidatus Levybacteria bacterium]|nr:MGMT family protein [Candidatus Levybacteria bacterium]
MVNSFEKIYKVVSRIPKGKVLTYKKVALLAEISNPRVVGFAMHANKDIVKVPCHRVIGSYGQLTGYARGGITKKENFWKRKA